MPPTPTPQSDMLPTALAAQHDKSGRDVTGEQEIISQRPEYCSELYTNDNSYGKKAFLDYNQLPEDLQPVCCKKVQTAEAARQKGEVCQADNS